MPGPSASADPSGPPLAGGAVFRPGELDRSTWQELAAMVPDVGRLLRDLVADPRVPVRAKVLAAAAAVYVAVPVGPFPEVVRGTGIGVDDLVALAWAVRQLIALAGYDVVLDLWRGTDAGFVFLMLLTGVDQ